MRFRDMPKLPLVLIAAMVIAGAVAYPGLPERIPMHWNAAGQIDGWSDKSVLSVFSQPLIAIGLYVLLWVAPYFDPKRANLLRSKQLYGLIVNLVTALLTAVFVGTLFAAHNNSLPMDKIVLAGVGVMFIVLGNYMGRVKRNWTMGVRYGWTLSDDRVWAKTNRLGGYLFVAAGVLSLVGVLLPGPWAFGLMMVPVLGMLPITYVYSMLLYRRLHAEEVAEPMDEEPVDDASVKADE